LTSGTSRWGHRFETASGQSYDLKSISKLIQQCKDSGVSRLKLGDLEVRFDIGQLRQAEPLEPEFQEFADSSARDSAPVGEGKPPKVPKDLVERFAEEQQLFDDPLAFETQLIDQHLSGRAETNEEA
jgi:hypothetical protein